MSAVFGLICGCADKGSNSKDEEAASPIVGIISDYLNNVSKMDQSKGTAIQRQKAMDSVNEEFVTHVKKCGVVCFTSRLKDVTPIGEHWSIDIDLPKELKSLARKRAFGFGYKLYVNLDKKDALSLKKGDPVIIQGTVSYQPDYMLMASDALKIVIGDHIIAIPVSDSVTCSVGPFKSLPVYHH